jgi:hypothetical protein
VLFRGVATAAAVGEVGSVCDAACMASMLPSGMVGLVELNPDAELLPWNWKSARLAIAA